MKIAIKVYHNTTERINMDTDSFNIKDLNNDFDSDPEIWRIEFINNNVIVNVWEKEVEL